MAAGSLRWELTALLAAQRARATKTERMDFAGIKDKTVFSSRQPEIVHESLLLGYDFLDYFL